MRTRILSDTCDINFFVSEYNRLAGSARYTTAQLAGLKIRAFYDFRMRMVAGYAINDRFPYKTLSYIPDDLTLHGKSIKQENGLRFAEVIALWIGRSASNGLRAFIYSLSVIDCALLRPNFILGGCSLKSARRTQMRALPNLLWQGEGKPFKRGLHNWVYFATPLQAILRLPYALVMGWLDRWRPPHRKRKKYPRRSRATGQS